MSAIGIKEPKYREKIILGMTYTHCEQCDYMVPQIEVRYFERKWFFGLFHHHYRICIQCLKKLGIAFDDKRLSPGPKFEAWIENSKGERIG